MKKTSLLAAVLVLLLLAGCGSVTPPPALAGLFARFSAGEADDGDSAVYIYRVAADPAESGDLMRTEFYAGTDAAPRDPEELIAAFTAPAHSGEYAAALPPDVTVESWRLENGVLTLELSPSFLTLPDMDRTVAAFAAMLTLCQLDAVEAVTVAAGGQTLFPGLVPEDAFLNAADTDPYVRQLRLYFPDSDGRYLISEYHSLTLDEDTSPERYIIEELLRGPNSGDLKSVIPAGTTLLSCVTADGVCTVDLSQEFYDNRPRTALGERLVLYSLADSLTAISAVDSVRLLVEGQPLDAYVYRSLAEPIARYDEVVGPVSVPKGETDADLYLAVPDLTAITPLPFRIAAVEEGDYASLAEAVLAELLTAEEPGYPVLFPGSGSVMDVTVQGTVCTVDLSESFFVSLPDNARNTAVQSMAATLCALSGIDAVRFTVGGGPAVFDGTDWSGPWRSFGDIIVE